ncbi:hypothetical protein [Pseudooceanicola nitratireducens]|uniref:hypothetical protein n=1 Tax=Pseudooceanicola nitratireducens TaxID=517719 RepID=UPI001C96288B|nr:hypothetical protein [Pseudooceanicola nitratireducens]MBY6158607.1 hypothetical protein [Pseudooceanicola nitratireducens]
MTSDELDRATHDLIEDIAGKAPGTRHRDLTRLHEVMGQYRRAGRATPRSLRNLLEVLTTEEVEARFDNMPV